MRSDKHLLKEKRLHDYQDHEAMLTQQRAAKGRVEGSRTPTSQTQSLQHSQRSHHGSRKNRSEGHRTRIVAPEARYQAPAQPEPAYMDVHRGESAPSPRSEPADEVYQYTGYSPEKGQHFEFDDDRPLSRKRIACLRAVQVRDNHIHHPPPFNPGKEISVGLLKPQNLRSFQVYLGM